MYPRSRGWRHCPAAIWLILLLMLPALPARAQSTPVATPPPVVDAPVAAADLLPAHRAEVWPALAATMSAYTMTVTLDPIAGTIGGTMTVTYYNNTSATPLTEIYFRLYPNIAYYGVGGTALGEVTSDGAVLATTLELDDSAARVALPAPLAPGAAITLAVPFVTTVPADSSGSYGIFAYDSARGTWILADWHPVLAVYEEETGWQLDPPTSAGDPTHAASSRFDVTVTAPEWLTVVASGVTVAESVGDGLRTQRVIAGPAREFTLVADDDYQVRRDTVEGVSVAIYTAPHVAPEVAATTSAIVAQALAFYGEAFGPYPFATLDIVDTRLSGALAVSWSGLIFLDGETMFDQMALTDPVGFETVVAHEIVHQWWGGLVGSNSNRHTYINEGLATLSSLLYLEATATPAAAAAAREAWVLGPARLLLNRGDMIVDTPVTAGEDPNARSAAVYGKATLGFEAIRAAIGNEAFGAALRAYADAYRFRIAEPDDLRAAFATAGDQNIDALWAHWFDTAALTAAEIDPPR